MQTSSRDGDIHSFAHVIPACRLAGWLVVIGGAAERTVMPHMAGAGLSRIRSAGPKTFARAIDGHLGPGTAAAAASGLGASPR